MDKSGSMGSCASDAIGGFNQFLEEQQAEPGEANLTLVLFDTTYNIPISGKPIKDVEKLTSKTYRPGGNTALNDAVARAIIETGKRLEDMPEADRPNKVLCIIITDGHENSSKEHSRAQVQEMVKHQEEKYDWAFIYLGANVDAFAEARHLGIPQNMAVAYAAGSIGTRSAYKGSSEAAKRYRSGGKKGLVDESWKREVKN
jgi:uncharacterized protein YegL